MNILHNNTKLLQQEQPFTIKQHMNITLSIKHQRSHAELWNSPSNASLHHLTPMHEHSPMKSILLLLYNNQTWNKMFNDPSVNKQHSPPDTDIPTFMKADQISPPNSVYFSPTLLINELSPPQRPKTFQTLPFPMKPHFASSIIKLGHSSNTNALKISAHNLTLILTIKAWHFLL